MWHHLSQGSTSFKGPPLIRDRFSQRTTPYNDRTTSHKGPPLTRDDIPETTLKIHSIDLFFVETWQTFGTVLSLKENLAFHCLLMDT